MNASFLSLYIFVNTPVQITGTPSEITLPQSEDYEYQATFGTEYWFKIENCAFSTFQITATYNSTDALTGFISIRIYDNAGSTIDTISSPSIYSAQEAEEDSIILASQIGATYFVRIAPLSVTGDTGSECTLIYTEAPADDNGDDSAGNDTAATATPLAENIIFNAYGYDVDFYTFTLEEPSQVRIDLQYRNFIDGEFILLDSRENTIQTEIEYKDLSPNIMRCLDAGTYLIKVINDAYPRITDYSICWYLYTPQPTMDDIYEDNDTFESATPILQGVTMEGINDDLDYYSIVLTEPGTIEITCVSAADEGDIDLSLFDSSYSHVYSTCREGNTEEIIYSLSSAGTYYILVYPYDADLTPYSLTWNIEP